MSKFDASIPVLTEVLQDQPPAPAPDEAAPASTPADAAPAASAPHAEPSANWPFRVAAEPPAAPSDADAIDATDAVDAPDAAQADAVDWAHLERQVTERVLQQLSNRVDFVLEQRIKDSMAEVLSHALRGLTDEIRAGLHETIGKIVTRAVQQEITHLQASAPKQSDKR